MRNLAGGSRVMDRLLTLGATSCLRIQRCVRNRDSLVGKGQLVSSGDAGLGIWKSWRSPAVLLASAWLRNKKGLIPYMKFKIWNIEHYLRGYSQNYQLVLCFFIGSTCTY